MISDDTIVSEENVRYVMSKTVGHIEVEYLEATGTQYINTNFIPSNNTRLVAKLSPTVITDGDHYGGMFFGSGYPNYNSQSIESYIFSPSTDPTITEGVFTINYGSENVESPTAISIGDVIELDINKNRSLGYRGGEIVYDHTFSQQTFTSNVTLNLFALNRQDNYYGGSKIYYFKIYENDVLVRDFIPVLKNGIPVMYDQENDKYYYNSGTGTFLYGPEVVTDIEQDKPANLATVSRFFEYEKKDLYLDKPLSISDLKYFCDKNSANQNPYSNYIQLEYVEADGHQWIDTEFIPNQDTRVIMQCNMTSTITVPFFGSRDRRYGSKTFVLWKIKDNFKFDYGSNEYSISVKSSGNRFIYANGYGNTLVVDQLTTNVGNYTFSGKYPLYIFANIDDNGLDSRHPSGKIYLCYIYSGKGTNYMERRFVPAKRVSDGVSGLLDILNCKFYESLGEPWIAGPEVGPMPNFSLKDYDFLETADSSNDTYLDTGFIPNQDTRLVMEMKKIENTETYHQFIFCSRNSPKPSYGMIKVQNSNVWRDDYANSSVNVSNALNGGASLTQRMLIDKNKNYTNIGNCGVSHTYTNFALNNTLVLYGAHQKNSELLMDIDMALYWCRVYDNGILIRNYYPAQRKSDNAVGLYDFVNSTFTLPVSGTLTAGTVIPKYINKEV